MFAYNTYKQTQLFFPTLLSPKAFLEFFKEAFFFMLSQCPSHPSPETSKRCSKPQPTTQVPGFRDLNKKKDYSRETLELEIPLVS